VKVTFAKTIQMERTQSRSKYWIYFFISLAVMVGFMIFLPEFFWTILPFVVTYFALAMDLM
jgi:uncharacterized membrane protein YhaH (DUF805 family)